MELSPLSSHAFDDLVDFTALDRTAAGKQHDVHHLLSLLPRDDRERFLSPREQAGTVHSPHDGTVRLTTRRGQHLFLAGDLFCCLYAIRSGFFKTNLVDSSGREQVTGFSMGGDILGMDGLGSGRYKDCAIALEDSEVYAIPYALIEEVGRRIPSVQRRLHAVLAGEIVRCHSMMMMLGSLSAAERIAAFLIDLSKRLLYRGYSPTCFVLRMTRNEIGSFLGLELETVSRILSTFQRNGLIEVQQKRVSIIDSVGLERVYQPHN